MNNNATMEFSSIVALLKRGVFVFKVRLAFFTKVSLVLVFVACMLCLPACSQQQQPAARFGNHTISEDEVATYTQQYRSENGLEDDVSWANYLATSALTTQTWRERVIRQLADQALIEDKAAELGITVNAEDVDKFVAQQKTRAGVADNDEQAWIEYLSQHGLSVEGIMERAEFNSLEQQVFKSELDFSQELENEMCNDYIKVNLADQVVRRYYAVEFEKNDKDQARMCLDDLTALEGAALVERVKELASEHRIPQPLIAEDGDMGWDFLYSEALADPKLKLRHAKLEAGTLFPKLLKGTDAYRVVCCAERHEFVDNGMRYEKIESESLKETISSLTMASSWAAKCMQYMSDLEEAANIQVSQMPSGLPYDVTEAE